MPSAVPPNAGTTPTLSPSQSRAEDCCRHSMFQDANSGIKGGRYATASKISADRLDRAGGADLGTDRRHLGGRDGGCRSAASG